jgi:hypothetical protein
LQIDQKLINLPTNWLKQELRLLSVSQQNDIQFGPGFLHLKDSSTRSAKCHWKAARNWFLSEKHAVKPFLPNYVWLGISRLGELESMGDAKNC